MVKYIYKDKTPVAEVWPTKKKMDTASALIIGGITFIAIFGVAYAWWQLNKPTAEMRMRTCHTCGSK